VFVGGMPSVGRWRLLSDSGVKRVVWLLSETPPDVWLAETESLLWLPIPDLHAPSVRQLEVGCAFLDAARRDRVSVLICCGAGAGRAPTVYIAWWLSKDGGSLEEGINAIKRVRPLADPTPAQRELLRQWHEQVLVRH